MAFTDLEIKNLSVKDKPYKVGLGEGLQIHVKPNGRKHWKLKYRYAGKEKSLSMGEYTSKTQKVSLKEATEAAREAKKLLKNGVDPSAEKKREKNQKILNADNSFHAIAHAWHKKEVHTWSEGHAKKILRLIGELTPWIGREPINEIIPKQLLAALRRIENRGAYDTAHRTKQMAGQIFRYGVSIGVCERDISQDLKKALTSPVVKHRAAITDINKIPLLLNSIDKYHGTEVVRAALQLAPLTFIRAGELRKAVWSDIDLDAAQWCFVYSKQKTTASEIRELIVPLSTQAVKILEDIHRITGRGHYVFPSARSNPALEANQRPMSENAVNLALRAMGYRTDEMCGSGFRAMARTVLDEELGYKIEWIEQQLSHQVKDMYGRAYNRAKYLKQRTKMMQGWADYLDGLKRNELAGNVVQLKRKR